MREVEAFVAGEVGTDVAMRPDLQVLVVEAKVGAARVHAALAALLLDEEGRVDEHAFGVGPIADDSQWVVALLDEMLRVLVSSPEYEMLPPLHVVAPELAGPGIVEDGAPVPQTEHQRLDRRAGQLVHSGLILLPLHRRLVHVDQRVPPGRGRTSCVVQAFEFDLISVCVCAARPFGDAPGNWVRSSSTASPGDVQATCLVIASRADT